MTSGTTGSGNQSGKSRKLKGLLALLLSFVLCASMLPAAVTTALATQEDSAAESGEITLSGITDGSAGGPTDGEHGTDTTPSITYVSVRVNASPEEGGEVSGADTKAYGSSFTVKAAPNTGWHFVEWQRNGAKASDNASYTFRAYSSQTLTAIFADDRHAQSDFKFADTAVKKVYGDADFIVAATGAVDGSNVTYTSGDASIAAVDENTGKVQIKGVGTTTIKAAATETSTHKSAIAEYTLTVERKQLTWDVSDLSAAKRQSVIGEVNIYGKLKLQGVINDEVEFISPAAGLKTEGFNDKTAVGSYTVSVLPVEGTWTFPTGDKANNYNWPTSNPTITAKVNVVTIDENVKSNTPDDLNKRRLDKETGISKVPDALKDNPELNTPVKIENAMRLAVENMLPNAEDNMIEVYDIELQIWNEADRKWTGVNPDNFPKDGVTVVLPYLVGTAGDTHNFTVQHMISHGEKAGEIENLAYEKNDRGLEVTFYNFSPVAVGAEKIATTETGQTTPAPVPTPESTPEPAPAPTDKPHGDMPETGDNSNLGLWLTILAISLAGFAVCGVVYYKQRRAG